MLAFNLPQCFAKSHQHVPIHYKKIVGCLTTLSLDNSLPWGEVLLLRCHISSKTMLVLGVMDRGSNCINSLTQYLVFYILPTMADIIIVIWIVS